MVFPDVVNKRSGSMNSHKDSKEINKGHFHKRTGSEDVSKKKERMNKAKLSDTPNADPFRSKRRKSTTGEERITVSIEHQHSNNSNRRANASLEERKSNNSSVKSHNIAKKKGKQRRAMQSLEKNSSAQSSAHEASVKISTSSRSSKAHHNSHTSEKGPAGEIEKSTKESSNIISTVDLTNAGSIRLNEAIVTEREKQVNFIKIYTKKHGSIPPTTLEFYKFVKLIGKGAFGKVTLGIHKLTGKHVAIKTFEKSYMKDDFSRKKVFQEVYILKKIHHSNIIRLLEVFESSKHFFIVMEYAGAGDLLHYVKKKRRLPENEARFIFKQILYGLGHCHCRSVLHRDIKLDNVLLDNEKGIKLCDFGVSKIIK